MWWFMVNTLVLLLWVSISAAQNIPYTLFTPVDLQHPLARGLQDWWRVVPQWAGGTTWYNLIPNGTPLALSSMTAVGTTGFGGSTAYGSAGELRFNGSGNQPKATASTGMIGGLTTFTVIVGYRSSTQAKQALYTEANGTAYLRFNLRDTASNEFDLFMKDDANTFANAHTTVSTLLDGFRHYAVALQTSKSARSIWFDGVQVATDATTLGTASMAQRIIGNNTGPNSAVNGALEEVLVYTRALSTAEIRAVLFSARQGHPGLLRRVPIPMQGSIFAISNSTFFPIIQQYSIGR